MHSTEKQKISRAEFLSHSHFTVIIELVVFLNLNESLAQGGIEPLVIGSPIKRLAI